MRLPPDKLDAARRYERGVAALRAGRAEELEALAGELEGFPGGTDPYLGCPWTLHAIDVGSLESIRWLVGRGVELAFQEAGYSPLHSALDRPGEDRLEVLRLLLRAGAPADLKGINDWTPAHMAAARNDVPALRVLVEHGADLSIRTAIDDCATPLEEARHLGCRDAVAFLESLDGSER